MTAEVFIDTNVFLYSLSDQPEEQPKAERARNVLLNDAWGWSVQVAGSFTTSPPHRSASFVYHIRLPRIT